MIKAIITLGYMIVAGPEDFCRFVTRFLCHLDGWVVLSLDEIMPPMLKKKGNLVRIGESRVGIACKKQNQR